MTLPALCQQGMDEGPLQAAIASCSREDALTSTEWARAFTRHVMRCLSDEAPHRLLGLVAMWAGQCDEGESPEVAAEMAAAWWRKGGARLIGG